MVNEERDLLKTNALLIEVNTIISGNESLFDDIFTKIKEVSLLTFKAVFNGSINGLIRLFRNANTAMIKAFGTNLMNINHTKERINRGVKEDDLKGFHLTKGFLEETTATGHYDDVVSSASALLKTLDILDRNRLEIERIYQKELDIFSQFKQIKTTEDAVNTLKKFEEIRYPSFHLPHKDNFMLISEVLPAGKVLRFNSETFAYSLETKSVSGDSQDTLFSTDDTLTLLSKLASLDTFYKSCESANSSYISYLSKYNTVVKEAFNHIDGLKGDISNSLIRDLLSRLEGNIQIFSFYTSFLPKVMSYVDSYMVNTTNYFSKQFN